MTTLRHADANPEIVLAEHRAIWAAVRALEIRSRAPAVSAPGRWLKRLAEELDALAGLLRPHFAREEAGGMFDEIAALDPASTRECARLRAQHRELLEDLAALETKVGQPGLEAQAVEGVRRALRRLIDDLSRHESSENALLVRAVEAEEVGAPD